MNILTQLTNHLNGNLDFVMMNILIQPGNDVLFLETESFVIFQGID